jgi:hypothetical protein
MVLLYGYPMILLIVIYCNYNLYGDGWLNLLPYLGEWRFINHIFWCRVRGFSPITIWLYLDILHIQLKAWTSGKKYILSPRAAAYHWITQLLSTYWDILKWWSEAIPIPKWCAAFRVRHPMLVDDELRA